MKNVIAEEFNDKIEKIDHNNKFIPNIDSQKYNSNTNNMESLLNISFEDKIIIEQNFKYYLEFCKLKEANNILKRELNLLGKEKNSLKQEINKIEVQIFIIFI
jgi:hypothetical protein